MADSINEPQRKIQVLAYQRRASGPGHIGLTHRMEVFAAERGWTVEQIFQDLGPAPKEGLRLQLQSLIAHLDPEADERHVLIDTPTDLDRMVDRWVVAQTALIAEGAQIHFMNLPDVSEETAKLLVSMAMLVDDHVAADVRSVRAARQRESEGQN